MIQLDPAARAEITADAGLAPVVVSQLVEGVNVDAVAAAVRTCAGVSDLYAGRFAEVGTYLPGRRVPGVTVSDGILAIHVRARWAVPADALLAEVSEATSALRQHHELRVVIADIDDPVAQTASPIGSEFL